MDQTHSEEDNITFDLCANFEEISLFKSLITCQICNNILVKPKKCSTCSSVYCERCLYNAELKKRQCPSNCKSSKLSDTDMTFNRFLNLVKLKCSNESCNYSGEYDNFMLHLKFCEKKLVKCMNFGCERSLNQSDLLIHIEKECDFTEIKCPCCNLSVLRNHFVEHFSNCSTSFKNCNQCKNPLSSFEVCICLKKYCLKCFENPKLLECAKTCFLFENHTNKTNNFFNISLRSMPPKFSARIKILNFTVFRIGVTTDNKILEGNNNPGFGNVDLYPKEVYLMSLNGLRYYTTFEEWFDIVNSQDVRGGFKAGDIITIEGNNQYITFYKNDVKIRNSLVIQNYDVNSTKVYILTHSKAKTVDVAKNRNQVEIESFRCI